MVGAAILGVGGVALWYRKRGASTMYTAASETKDEDPKTDIKGFKGSEKPELHMDRKPHFAAM